MAQQDLTTQARGLWITSNPLDAPPGSLSEATNAVVRRRGVVEPRRGQAPDATVPSSAYVDAMASFEGELIVHTSADALAKRDSSTTITAYSGTYTAPTGHPVRFAEASGGLYATTNAGPVRLDSPSSAWVAAGVPPGLEGRADASGTSGWIDYGETVGYRLVWGRRDGDGQLMVGAPSGRILYTATDAAVAVTLARAGTTVTATTSSAHGLTTGDTVETVTTSSDTDFPLGTFTITVTGATTFTYTQSGTDPAAGSGTYMEGSSTRDVAITAPIPDGVLLDIHFLQVYRTINTTTGGIDPGEDMAQVGEYFPSASEITAGSISVVDISPFANGPWAYFNPSLGIGISGAKEDPPLLTDAVAFNGYMVGVVQEYRATLTLALLAVGSGGALSVGDGLTFTDGTTTETYKGALAESFPDFFDVYTSGTTGQNIEETARSLVRAINSRSGGLLYATYVSSIDGIPGRILLTTRQLGGDPIRVDAIFNGDAWAPRLTKRVSIQTATRVGSTVTLDFGGNPHGLSVGDTFDILDEYGDPSDETLFPPGEKTVVTVPASDELTYTEAGTAGTNLGSMTIAYSSEPVYLEQAATGSDYAFSDLEEPDAWPPRFRFKVGGPNVTLYRILPQGNALLFFTSEGLYRLTGRTADEFVLLPMDPTVKLVGPKTAVSMANRVFALTNEGVISVTDLGVEKISEPVDLTLLPYYAGDLVSLTDAAAFGTAYESENEYILWIQSPDAEAGDPPDRAYTYNIQTGTWVGPWEFSWSGINTGNEVRSAHVHTGDGRLYIAAGSRLTRERKARALADYQDATGVGIPFDVATVVNTAKNPGAYKQWVEATVLLEKPQPASVDLYFTTEIDDVEEGATITTQGNAAVRSYIPLDKSRSARLTVGLRHSTAEEKPTILGVQTIANITSTRVGR